MNINKWLIKNKFSLSGKRVVITGATGGLGKHLSLALARLNANVVLACRNEALANTLKNQMLKINPSINVDFVPLDLSGFESVNKFIKQIKQYEGIDILVHNAGIYNVPLKKLDSGYNNVFQINFVYPYYITKKLLPELQKKENSICLAVSSIAHNYSKTDKKDIDFSTRNKPSKIYGNSKRYLTFALYELFKSEKKVKLPIAHPGITLTNMTNHYPRAINWLVKIGIKLLFPSPQKAVRNFIYALYNPCDHCEWIGPKYFNIWGAPKKKPLKTASQEEINQIFKTAEDIYNNLTKM